MYYLSFFLIFLNPHPAKSEIQTITISSDGRRFILFEDFGFRNQGYISISISSIAITTTKSGINPTKLSFMGCFYGPTPARHSVQLALLKDVCIIGNPFVFPILNFNEKTILSKPSFNKTVPVTIPDLYYIFFVNCAMNTSVSMTVNLETYNVKSNGNRDYMDEHLANLPTTLFVFALVFFVFVLAWAYACNKNKHFLNKIHILMALLLFLKFLELISHANSLHLIRLTGSPHGWNILWLMFYFARNVLFVVVIMLIGVGWSLFRQCLEESQKCTICIALFFQFVASVTFILIHSVGLSSRNYRYWTVTYYAVDFLCCVMMMVPVHKAVDNLGGVCSKIEGKESRRSVHKRVYDNYALAVYVYVGFTRLGMFALRSITSYKFLCLTIAVELTIEALFYVVVYMMFWPSERYDYVVVEDREGQHNPAATLSDLRTVF